MWPRQAYWEVRVRGFPRWYMVDDPAAVPARAALGAAKRKPRAVKETKSSKGNQEQ